MGQHPPTPPRISTGCFLPQCFMQCAMLIKSTCPLSKCCTLPNQVVNIGAFYKAVAMIWTDLWLYLCCYLCRSISIFPKLFTRTNTTTMNFNKLLKTNWKKSLLFPSPLKKNKWQDSVSLLNWRSVVDFVMRYLYLM